MNNAILEQYGLMFRVITDVNNNREARVYGTLGLSLYLDDYFMTGNYKEFYEEELLPEINKAIEGLPFIEDGGGEHTFLTIGYPLSYLDSINGINPQKSLPTEDLKEIIQSWIEFLNLNNLDK